MAAVTTILLLIGKLQAMRKDKEITSLTLRRQIDHSIEKLQDFKKVLTEAEDKQSSNQAINIDDLETQLLPRVYFAEDIIDTFRVKVAVQRQKIFTKVSRFTQLMSLWRQNSFSNEMKISMISIERSLKEGIGIQHDQTAPTTEAAQQSVSDEQGAHPVEPKPSDKQPVGNADPSISEYTPGVSDEQHVHTARSSNTREQISHTTGPTISGEQPVHSAKPSVSDGQVVHPAEQSILEGGANVSGAQLVHSPRPSTSDKQHAQTSDEQRAAQSWGKISDRLDEESDFVGREDQVKELAQAILKRAKLRFLILVVGAAGSGKTAIVRTVYNRTDTVKHFPCRAWLHVSKEFAEKDLLIDMLKQITTIKDEERLALDKLTERVRNVLIRKRYLIVLDDVRSPDAWNSLKQVFVNSLNGSRVIITSRHKNVVDTTDDAGTIFSLELGQLANDKSWTLFLKKVRKTEESLKDSELKQKILDKCHGLPLTIVVLGGLLSTKELSKWSTMIDRATFGDDPSKAILTLAYEDLPSSLKPCLLYLGLFPKEFEIPIRRLYQLWAAEGLLNSSEGKTPEDLAETNFEELVKRNMIEVARWRLDGSPRKCRVPGILYDNVFPNAKDIGFFHLHQHNTDYRSSESKNQKVAENSDISNHSSSDTAKSQISIIRRVAEYSDIINYPFSDPYIGHLRSYISFNTRKGDTPANEVDKFLCKIIAKRSFGLLTVLDLERVYKPLLSEAIGKLLQLKYLGLRWTFLDSIPKSVGNLPCLETLDVKHTNISALPMSIWNSSSLRHLYMNEIYLDASTLKPVISGSLASLLTVWGLIIGKEGPSVEWLKRMNSLRKLGLTCHYKSLQTIAKWISHMESLRSLKLRSINEFSRPADLELGMITLSGHQDLTDLYLLGKLPKEISKHQLPENLKMLTLSVSKLERDPMEELGKLPQLNILRLFAYSYLGEEITCHSNGFPKLRVLKLWMLEKLEKWTVQEGSMHSLRELEIRHCEKLIETEGWKRLSTTLKELILTNMPEKFAKDIQGSQEWKNVLITVNNWEFSSLPEKPDIDRN